MLLKFSGKQGLQFMYGLQMPLMELFSNQVRNIKFSVELNFHFREICNSSIEFKDEYNMNES